MADSNLSCGPATVKYIVFLFNLLFCISGLALIIIGGIAQGFFQENVIFFENKYETPAIGLIIVGTVIMIVSFFGCCGAKKENVCMLKTFSGLMFILLLAEVAAVITVAVMKDDIKDLVNTNMKETLQQYGNKNHSIVTQTWDDMQKKYACCGVSGPSDWVNTTFSEGVNAPNSCCKVPSDTCGQGALQHLDRLFQEGCYDALKASAVHNLGAIIGGAVALALIQMVGIWMSCCLVRSVKERYEIL